MSDDQDDGAATVPGPPQRGPQRDGQADPRIHRRRQAARRRSGAGRSRGPRRPRVFAGSGQGQRGAIQPGHGHGPFALSWWRDWRDGAGCIVLAGGPSAAGARAGLERARGRCHVLAVNESYRLAPWADALYACDGGWWRARQGVPSFEGLKLSQDTGAALTFRDVHKVEISKTADRILVDEPGLIGHGGNSGFQALNIAIQFGARRIALVGFDMRLDRGLHWHGPHGRGLHNPNEAALMRWRRAFAGSAPEIAAMGIQVINTNPDSALTCFPFGTIEDVL